MNVKTKKTSKRNPRTKKEKLNAKKAASYFAKNEKRENLGL
jgi:hypothetical protein